MKTLLAAAFSFVALFAGACGGSSPAGVYELDKERLRADMLALKPEGTDAAAVEEGLSAMNITVDLAADGTAKIDSKIGGGADSSATGTWKADGNKLTLTIKDPRTGQDETNTGAYADGALTIDIGSLHMHFRRK